MILARSVSMMVSAILQLPRKVLLFSISHDHDIIKIYGHYALIKDKTIFHHHLVHSLNLTNYDGQNRWTAYDFVRKTYHHSPDLLMEIKDAIS